MFTSRGRRLLAVAAAVAGLTAPLVTGVAAAPQASAARPAVPEIAWQSCGDEPDLAPFECAAVEVPTDYDRPGGDTTTIALTRLPASDPEARIGSLFTNPGGPGGSGVDFVQRLGQLAYTPEVLARFDIIGFDPRGVARSEGATCFPRAEQESAWALDRPVFPYTAAQEPQYLRASAQLGIACTLTSPDRFAHMSTANVARDMDLLRQAVGDERLSYVGYSYGTYLGATYARLFPDNSRALVLDGAVEPAAYSGSDGDRRPLTLRIDQHLGAQETYQEFLRLCAEAGPQRCPLAALGDPSAAVDQILDGLRSEPVTVVFPDGSEVEVTYDLMVAVTFSSLYEPAQWTFLAALYVAVTQAAADEPVVLTPAQTPASLSGWPPLRQEEYPSIGGVLSLCIETARTGRPLQFPAFADRADAEARYFGRLRTWATQPCEFFGVRDRDAYTGPWGQRIDEPVLVIGTRFDPATPNRNTAPYADRFKDARVLTLDGWGHTILGKSTCADEAVARYLVELQAVDGASCAPDTRPFDPPVTTRSGDSQGAGVDAPIQTPLRDLLWSGLGL